VILRLKVVKKLKKINLAIKKTAQGCPKKPIFDLKTKNPYKSTHFP